MINTGIVALADKLGVIGEDGWLTEKLPAMYHSYDNPVDPAVDLGKHGLNVGKEYVDYVPQGIEATGDIIEDYGKWAMGGERPRGIGSLKTDAMDIFGPWLGPLTNGQGSGMEEESHELIKSFIPPENYTNLNSWDVYQNWKKGSGWDSADDRRVNKKVKDEMDKRDYSADALWDSFRDLGNQPGYEHYTESDDAINYYYPQYVEKQKNYDRDVLRDAFEFQDTGEDYGQWASQEYQNTLLNKYGKYPVIEDINEMSLNISPYGDAEGLTATFNRANTDYINALKKGESGMKPTEWDYGLFDDATSVGITQPHEPWLDYSTKEAEEFYEAPQALIPEILIGGTGLLKAPKLLKHAQAPLQGTTAGRYAREFAPGLFQWGKRDKFGFPKLEKDKLWKRLVNYGTTGIDFARPKGGQFIAAAAASELMDRD